MLIIVDNSSHKPPLALIIRLVKSVNMSIRLSVLVVDYPIGESIFFV